MDLSMLKPKTGSKKKKKRVGRGFGAGSGKTSGRGHKGQKSRSGGMKGTGFEGGQTPIYRRIPKRGSFKNLMFKKNYVVVNLRNLDKFKEKVSLMDFISQGVLKEGEMLKVLSVGELKQPLTVEAHAFSKAAKQKIEAAGGKALHVKKIKVRKEI